MIYAKNARTITWPPTTATGRKVMLARSKLTWQAYFSSLCPVYMERTFPVPQAALTIALKKFPRSAIVP